MYKLEKELVADFEKKTIDVKNPFYLSNCAFEFNYKSGRADIIAVSKNESTNEILFAFEAKLSQWRVALNQAYRTTSFAHFAYVVLPISKIKPALKQKHEFEKRGVGLCSISVKGIRIEIPAVQQEPLLPWLTDCALNYILLKE